MPHAVNHAAIGIRLNQMKLGFWSHGVVATIGVPRRGLIWTMLVAIFSGRSVGFCPAMIVGCETAWVFGVTAKGVGAWVTATAEGVEYGYRVYEKPQGEGPLVLRLQR